MRTYRIELVQLDPNDNEILDIIEAKSEIDALCIAGYKPDMEDGEDGRELPTSGAEPRNQYDRPNYPFVTAWKTS